MVGNLGDRDLGETGRRSFFDRYDEVIGVGVVEVYDFARLEISQIGIDRTFNVPIVLIDRRIENVVDFEFWFVNKVRFEILFDLYVLVSFKLDNVLTKFYIACLLYTSPSPRDS